MRIVAPTQSEVWNRFFATVLPMTQTLAAARTSPGVKKSPVCHLPIGHRQVVRVDADDLVRATNSGFRRPPGRWRTRRATPPARWGTPSAMASASAGVRVMTLFAPRWTPPLRPAARKHHDQVGAQVLKLLLNHQPGRLADRDQQDDGRHADDDSQHGQAGAHLVLRQGPERPLARSAGDSWSQFADSTFAFR